MNYTYEIEIEIIDIEFLIGFSQDPYKFKSLIKRFLQNTASITNLMFACYHELVNLKDQKYQLQLQQQEYEAKLLAEHEKKLTTAFKDYY